MLFRKCFKPALPPYTKQLLTIFHRRQIPVYWALTKTVAILQNAPRVSFWRRGARYDLLDWQFCVIPLVENQFNGTKLKAEQKAA